MGFKFDSFSDSFRENISNKTSLFLLHWIFFSFEVLRIDAIYDLDITNI